MTNSDIFLESIVHAPHSVYGYKLKPLSLFHFTMLEKYAPSVLAGDTTEADLKAAAAICASRDFEAFRKKAIGLRSYCTAFYSFDSQLLKFAMYLADYMTLPDSLTSDSKAEGNNPFPLSLCLAAQLMKATGCDFERVFYDMPISQVFWLVSIVGFIETKETNVISDKEKAAYAALEALKTASDDRTA